MNQRLAYIIFAFALIVAVVVGFYGPKDEGPSPSDFRAKVRENLPSLNIPLLDSQVAYPKRVPSSVTPTPSPTTGQAQRSATTGLEEEAFQRKYGEDLRFSRYEGRVIRIDGTRMRPDRLEGQNRVPGFRPSNESDLRSRASEILADAAPLLGVDPDTTFLSPLVEGGDTTGRVTYQQGIDGVPIYPGGTVTVVLGPRGELKAFDSSVYPATKIGNRATLPQPVDSRRVLYVTESEPVALLRYAYDSLHRGIQKVTDAENGEILLERDRRVR